MPQRSMPPLPLSTSVSYSLRLFLSSAFCNGSIEAVEPAAHGTRRRSDRAPGRSGQLPDGTHAGVARQSGCPPAGNAKTAAATLRAPSPTVTLTHLGRYTSSGGAAGQRQATWMRQR